MVNAVAWRGAGRAGCANSVSRCTANWSLESRGWDQLLHSNTTMIYTNGRGFSNLGVLEGIKVVLDVHDGRLLDGDSEERVRL